MKSLIQKLVESPSPSGYEAPVRGIIRSEVEALADEVRVDNLGNLIVRKGTRSGDGSLRIMIAAHMDEIGLIATHIDERGYVRFQPIGGVFPQYCLGGRVCFQKGVRGVVSSDNHLDRSKVPTIEQMYVDVGASSREDCPVQVGDVAAFERPFVEVGKRLVSKAMDDRIGVAVIIEALRQIQDTPHELYFVFSVQEEVGVRGATTSAFDLEPDLGIAVDITSTGDTPHGPKMAVKLGDGPAIKVRDAGMLVDRRVIDWMARTAEEAGIPYQLEILPFGGTDARAIQLSRAGVPAGCISIPCRYAHSPSEMVDYDDVQNAVRLLVELVSKPVEIGEL